MTPRISYRVNHCLEHPGPARYALRTLLEMVVSPACVAAADDAQSVPAGVRVTYGLPTAQTKGPCIAIYQSEFFGPRYRGPEVLPERPVTRVDGIPALFRDRHASGKKFFTTESAPEGTVICCHVDIVAGAFFMLSRYEETVSDAVDKFDRFPAEASVAYQEGFLEEPIVNEYAEQLLSMRRAAGFTGERRRWWGDAPWAIALTHDVDRMHRYHRPTSPVRSAARAVFEPETAGGRAGSLLADYLETVLHLKRDEFDCLTDIATWEAGLGMHASYYFLGDVGGKYGADYDVTSRGVVDQMRAIVTLGQEVGYHAGFNAYREEPQFRVELERVRQSGLPIEGGRQHFLRWRTPISWHLWEGAGLRYDSSVGYSHADGFRCGMCLPYRPYDVLRDCEVMVIEWPLMFMDATYYSSWSTGSAALERLSAQFKFYGGVLVMLWHPDNWSLLYSASIRSSMQDFLVAKLCEGVLIGSMCGLVGKVSE